jgi:curved DNA-binding protein CbpA
MKEINRAYEILGDVELKKRYDNGETDFTEYNDNQQKAAREAKEEEIKNLEKLAENAQKQAEMREKIWLINATYLDRYATYNRISEAMCFTLPRVRAENLDPTLWHSYQS